jgi:hypothetical protein
MSLLQKPEVQTLSEWLEIVTRKLTDVSKDRIRVEIEGHYTEAVEAHREEGLSETDARTKAVAELGDAKAAARRFRKQHLTEREEKMVTHSEKHWRKISSLVISYVFFGLFAPSNFPIRPSTLVGVLLGFAILIALPTICFAIARREKAKPSRFLVLLDSMSGFIPGYFLFSLLSSFFERGLVNFLTWLYIVCCLAQLRQTLLCVRIFMKLRKTPPLLGDGSPPDSVRA